MYCLRKALLLPAFVQMRERGGGDGEGWRWGRLLQPPASNTLKVRSRVKPECMG